MTNGIPKVILPDNVKQLISNFFVELFASLGTNPVERTEYHSQFNGHVERYNCTLIARLRHYRDEHQQYLDNFVQLLANANNT